MRHINCSIIDGPVIVYRNVNNKYHVSLVRKVEWFMSFHPSGNKAQFGRDKAVDAGNGTSGLGLQMRSEAAYLLDLGELLTVLRRRLGTIAVSVACCLALVGAYLLVTPEQFQSTARVLIDTRGIKTVSGEVVIPGLSSDIAMIESQVAMIGSSNIAERVIDRLGLAEDPRSPPPSSDIKRLAHRTDELPGPQTKASAKTNDAAQGTAPAGEAKSETRIDPTTRRAKLVEEIRRRLTVKRNGLTYLIDISYTDEDPEHAARMANAFADAYLADQQAAKTEATRTAAKWLKARVSELSTELRAAEEKVEAYKLRHDLVEVGDAMLIQQELAQYVSQLIAARNKVAEAAARRHQVEQVAKNPDRLHAIAKALDSPVIAEYRRQQAEIRRKLGDLESRYGETHALVANARAELANLDGEIVEETQRLAESVRNDYEAAKLQLSLLEEGYEELIDRFGKRNLVTVDLAELKRDAQATRELHASLLKRLKDTQAQQSLPSADARVVAYATPPLHPSKPKQKLALALALIGGLGVGVMLALVREHFERVFHGPDDLERATGAKPITMQPLAIKSHGSQLGLALGKRARRDQELYRYAETNPDSAYAQSIFRIKNWIDANVNRAGNIVAVGSVEPGAGKSTTAANLAQFAARSGQNVLLIDCDFRQPGLTAELAPDSAASLVDIVSGQRQRGDVILTPADTSFDFCPASTGNTREIPINVVASRAIHGFLEGVAKDYDLVILDTPAINRRVEASTLLAKSDLAVLIVCQERTTHQQLRRAVDMLNGPPADQIGFVLSELRPRDR